MTPHLIKHTKEMLQHPHPTNTAQAKGTRHRGAGHWAPARNPHLQWWCAPDPARLMQPVLSKQTEWDPTFAGWDFQQPLVDVHSGTFWVLLSWLCFAHQHFLPACALQAWCCSCAGLARKWGNLFMPFNGVTTRQATFKSATCFGNFLSSILIVHNKWCCILMNSICTQEIFITTNVEVAIINK